MLKKYCIAGPFIARMSRLMQDYRPGSGGGRSEEDASCGVRMAEQNHAINVMLRRLRVANTLGPTELAALKGLPITTKSVPEGAPIVKDGDRPSVCVVVVDGFVIRTKHTADGRRQIVSIHVPGDIPDLQSLHLHVMDHNVVALSESVVGFIPHESLHTLVDMYPKIAGALWRDTLIDAAIFREWIVNLGRRNATQRMAHLISEVARRLEEVGLKKEEQFPLPMTQQDLADALGLSTVHVNRVLQAIRKNDLLELRNGIVTLGDAGRLNALGDFDPTYLHASPDA